MSSFFKPDQNYSLNAIDEAGKPAEIRQSNIFTNMSKAAGRAKHVAIGALMGLAMFGGASDAQAHGVHNVPDMPVYNTALDPKGWSSNEMNQLQEYALKSISNIVNIRENTKIHADLPPNLRKDMVDSLKFSGPFAHGVTNKNTKQANCDISLRGLDVMTDYLSPVFKEKLNVDVNQILREITIVHEIAHCEALAAKGAYLLNIEKNHNGKGMLMGFDLQDFYDSKDSSFPVDKFDALALEQQADAKTVLHFAKTTIGDGPSETFKERVKVFQRKMDILENIRTNGNGIHLHEGNPEFNDHDTLSVIQATRNLVSNNLKSPEQFSNFLNDLEKRGPENVAMEITWGGINANINKLVEDINRSVIKSADKYTAELAGNISKNRDMKTEVQNDQCQLPKGMSKEDAIKHIEVQYIIFDASSKYWKELRDNLKPDLNVPKLKDIVSSERQDFLSQSIQTWKTATNGLDFANLAKPVNNVEISGLVSSGEMRKEEIKKRSAASADGIMSILCGPKSDTPVKSAFRPA